MSFFLQEGCLSCEFFSGKPLSPLPGGVAGVWVDKYWSLPTNTLLSTLLLQNQPELKVLYENRIVQSQSGREPKVRFVTKGHIKNMT